MRNWHLALAGALSMLLRSPASALEQPSFPDSIKFGGNAESWELRAGAGAYDTGPAANQVLSGAVLNGEILAPSPDFLAGIGAPRPYAGTDIAITDDDAIHVFYAGLNWEAYLTDKLYLGFSAGGAITTRDRATNEVGRTKDLGSHVLFHLQGSIGYDISRNVTVQAFYNHYSNAGLADSNPGLESVGGRVGVRF